MNRDDLHPADAPNPLVWCERCRRHHRQHTFTQADHDAVITEASQRLADSIDERALFVVMANIAGRIGKKRP